MKHFIDGDFMREAIFEAKKARDSGDYAIGAVLVKEGKIIERGANAIIKNCDPTNHVEIVAIRNACSFVGSRHLEEAVLYTTHEPCPMCAGAAIMAKLDGIVYGAKKEDMFGYSTRADSGNRFWRTNKVSAYDIIVGVILNYLYSDPC